jgi:hypothetical protein
MYFMPVLVLVLFFLDHRLSRALLQHHGPGAGEACRRADGQGAGGAGQRASLSDKPAFPVQHAQRHRRSDTRRARQGGGDGGSALRLLQAQSCDQSDGGSDAGRKRWTCSASTWRSSARAFPNGCASTLRSTTAAPRRVPALLLQPLVENAVKHGVARSEGPTCIRIRARLDGPVLEIVVENDAKASGPGSAGEKVGLRNVTTGCARASAARPASQPAR